MWLQLISCPRLTRNSVYQMVTVQTKLIECPLSFLLWVIIISPEIDLQPLVSSGRLSVSGGLGWCRYTPGGSTSSHCPSLLFPHAPHNSPSGHCKTLPYTEIHEFSKTSRAITMKFDNIRLIFYLKYWLAAASMVLWQGKSCPWTQSTTSVSSLFTRRVSIPLWSSTGRPPSSQQNSFEPVRFSLSSTRIKSSPRDGNGQSVVLSSEALIFYIKISLLSEETACSSLRCTCTSKKDACGLRLQFSHVEMWICFFFLLYSSYFLFLFRERC